jgi:hypothetical protein
MLPLYQKFDHVAGVRAPVDVVSDQDESCLAAGADLLARQHQRLQFVKAAVNVADCKG